jgi:hypothetical protein
VEKYGVACGCPEGKPDTKNFIKLGNGNQQCGVCGREYKLDRLHLEDTVKVTDTTGAVKR